jgi:hypothetical protein
LDGREGGGGEDEAFVSWMVRMLCSSSEFLFISFTPPILVSLALPNVTRPSHQHPMAQVLWGHDWNESCVGWSGDLPDLVRANRFEEASEVSD